MGTRKIRPTSWVFFFLPAYGWCCSLVITCKARHGQIQLNVLCENRIMWSVIACTARHGHHCFHSEAWSEWEFWCWRSVASRGMARLSWTSFGRTWFFHVPSIVRFYCFASQCLAFQRDVVLTGGNRVNPLPAEAKLSGENYCEAYELKLTSGKFSQGRTLSWALLFFTIPTLLLVPWRKI